METVHIGFSYNKTSVISKAIQLAENSKYSHVYIRRASKYGEYVYQASGIAVNFMNINIFLKDNVIVEEYEFELTDEKKEKLLEFFVTYAGAGYELKSLFKLLYVVVGERVGLNVKVKTDEKQDSKFICSELAAFLCEQILDIDIPGDINFVTPKKINPIIRANGVRVI